MYLNSTKFLFLNILIIGVIMCLCSNNWLMLWIGLEMSLLSFIPLMMNKNLLSSECMMKYYIIQSMSSSILIMGMIMFLMMLKESQFIMIFSLMLKIGVAPFHNWVLSVIEGLTYNSLFLMLTIMKFSPLIILSYINKIIWIPVIFSLIVGAIMGINQNSFRKMIAYSSIFNMGFIFSCINEISYWMMYMLVYSFILFCVIFIIKNLNISYLNQILINDFDLKIKLMFWIMMASLGGIPPMLGFFNKLIIFELMIMNNHFLILFFMLISSLIVIFYYTRSSYLSIMMSSSLLKWNLFTLNETSLMILFMNLIFLFLLVFSKILS
uniref:NADH-ubiquinone oxidoreductase chain 2 n=1 Tax=Stenatkina angustata TaxID=700816 RepID=A0A9E9G9R9_9HEMI|nr:NADH dehydrogenase subunit 2 [Stenatkina angustata]WAP91619.1 NADH dehydrogenase subunit 2 [Stenatkina angustata]